MTFTHHRTVHCAIPDRAHHYYTIIAIAITISIAILLLAQHAAFNITKIPIQGIPPPEPILFLITRFLGNQLNFNLPSISK